MLGEQDWVSSVTVAYTEYNDGIVFLLGQRYPDGSFRPPGTTWNNAPWGEHPAYQGQALGNLLLGTNGVKTRATQLLLSLQKPYTPDSGWGVTFAYTYTDGEENRLNTARDDDTYVFDYPTIERIRLESVDRRAGASNGGDRPSMTGHGVSVYRRS